MPLITGVSPRFNSTELIIAICRAEGVDFGTLTEEEKYKRLDICQQALDDLTAQDILKVGSYEDPV